VAVPSSNALVLTPAALGPAADFGAHFAFWKLHKVTLRYVPDIRPVSTAGTAAQPGVVAIGFVDDPARMTSTPLAGSIADLRVSGEFALDKAWKLVYVPVGPQARWLDASQVATSSANTLRFAAAGHITWISTIASSFVSGTTGRILLDFECSFKGAAGNVAPTLTLVESKMSEEKKSDIIEDYVKLDRPSTTATAGGAGLSRVARLVSQFGLDEVKAAALKRG